MKPVYITLIFILILFACLFVSMGYDGAFQVWQIPTMTPHFADIRTLTHGSEAIAIGVDPMVENPGDPWSRKLNYPRVWQLLYNLGLNSSHTALFGGGIVLSFVIGVLIFLNNANLKLCLFMLPALLSPAVLLGVERGNLDLFMFFLVCVSIAAMQRHYLWSVFFIGLSFILKLFPILAAVFLVRLTRKKVANALVILSLVLFSYLFISYSDLKLIQENTVQGDSLSYGMMMLSSRIYGENPQLGLLVKSASILFTILWFIYLTRTSYLNRELSAVAKYNNSPYIDYFRAGACIYIGTFIVGTNWDYRLIFLLLTLPQLCRWYLAPVKLMSIASNIAIVSILLSMWFLLFGSWYIDQLSKWLIFLSLSYLLFFSTMQTFLNHFKLIRQSNLNT